MAPAKQYWFRSLAKGAGPGARQSRIRSWTQSQIRIRRPHSCSNKQGHSLSQTAPAEQYWFRILAKVAGSGTGGSRIRSQIQSRIRIRRPHNCKNKQGHFLSDRKTQPAGQDSYTQSQDGNNRARLQETAAKGVPRRRLARQTTANKRPSQNGTRAKEA